MAGQLKRRRERLFKKHPFCYWCNCELIESTKKNRRKHNVATIDHLRSRLDPSRQIPNYDSNIRTVLSCRRCNNERAKEEVSKLTKKDLWERAKRYPKNHKKKIKENKN